MKSEPNPVLAKEVHASALWAAVLAVPSLAELVILTRVHHAAIQIVLSITAVVMFLSMALAWSGFLYLFTPAGVEIRTMGFRLRFIAASDIQEYRSDRWSAIGGYGIRIWRNRSAYVWGSRGVRIKTTNGEVFLGTKHPERIIYDLGLIKQFTA